MTFLWNVVSMLVLIGVMVFIHELGHYLAAIWFRVRVEAFSLGFGPKLLGFVRNGTDFKICAIPLGGYVKMAGEMFGDGIHAKAEHAEDPNSFLAKPRWQRLIIAAAGPAMNVLLAVVLLTGLYMYRFPKFLTSGEAPVVMAVEPNSPAAKAGLQEGDRIVEIGGIRRPGWEDVFKETLISVSKPLQLVYERDGKRVETRVTPREDPRTGLGDLGIEGAFDQEVGALTKGMPAERAGMRVGDWIVSVDGKPIRGGVSMIRAVRAAGSREIEVKVERAGQEMVFRMTPQQSQERGEEQAQWRIGVAPVARRTFVSLPLGEAFAEAVQRNIKDSGAIYRLLQGLVERRISAKTVEGPLRLAVVAGDSARDGADSYIGLMAAVSLNLAIINLLPIPILDGGMILMLLIEMAARRDLSLKLKEAVLKVGLAFLLVMMVVVMYNDISKLIR
jgi:regulator of sigma E protease